MDRGQIWKGDNEIKVETEVNNDYTKKVCGLKYYVNKNFATAYIHDIMIKSKRKFSELIQRRL